MQAHEADSARPASGRHCQDPEQAPLEPEDQDEAERGEGERPAVERLPGSGTDTVNGPHERSGTSPKRTLSANHRARSAITPTTAAVTAASAPATAAVVA